MTPVITTIAARDLIILKRTIQVALKNVLEPENKKLESNPESYDLAGAAAHLGMSRRKLREMIKDRRITCARIDCRNFLITEADLNEVLAT